MPFAFGTQALSNQKYAEFKTWFSKRGLQAGVALLTGDIKIRSPPGTTHELIICTSEILRNKLVKCPNAPLPSPPNICDVNNTANPVDAMASSLRDLDLDNLGVVVSDEIHYINDTERGIVWEETLIHLPPSVQVCSRAEFSISLKITASEELGAISAKSSLCLQANAKLGQHSQVNFCYV